MNKNFNTVSKYFEGKYKIKLKEVEEEKISSFEEIILKNFTKDNITLNDFIDQIDKEYKFKSHKIEFIGADKEGNSYIIYLSCTLNGLFNKNIIFGSKIVTNKDLANQIRDQKINQIDE